MKGIAPARCRALALLVVLGLMASGAWAAPAGAVVSDDADVTWMTNGVVYAILVSGDKVYIGGTFTQVRSPNGTQTIARNNVAAIDRATGVVDAGWNPNANGEVDALASDGTSVYVGGLFTTIGGMAKSRLAALDPVTGAARATWTANANGRVRSLAAASGRVFAGGSFTSINDGTGATALSRLAALEAATGRVVPGWRPSANANVRAVELSSDRTRLFVGGDFTSISGAAHNRIAAVSTASGAVDGAFRADGQYLVFDLAATPNALYAAIGGPGGRVNSYNTSTGTRNWTVNTRGDVQAVAVDGDSVYAGGHYNGDGEFAGVTRFRLAAVDTQARVDTTFVPELSGQVWALTTEPGRLYAGGDFVRINGRVQQSFARFSEGDVADTTPPDTMITSGPSGTVTDSSASFAFTATEPSTFQCSLDGGGYLPCTSPVGYTGLADGPHTFGVRATDGAGNTDPSPAVRNWAIGIAPPPGGPIISVGATSSGSSLARSSISIAVPSGTAAGDVMLASIVSNDDDPAFAAPAGWTLVRENVLRNLLHQAVYVRVAGPAEPGAYAWTLSTTRRLAGGITTYRGVDPGVPIDAHGGQVNSAVATTVTAPSVTTTVAGGLLVHFAALSAEGTLNPPAGMTERWEATAYRADTTRDVTTSAADVIQAVAGPSGVLVATASQPGASIGAVVALRPAVP